MDYEELYSQLKEVETGLKNNIKNIKKTEDNIAKNAESGDLKMLRKNAENLSQLLSASQTMLEEFREIAGAFDEKAYFESGDFARQLMQCCEEKGVDVKGDFPIYEMFPYRVRIDAENQDLYMNRKNKAVHACDGCK